MTFGNVEAEGNGGGEHQSLTARLRNKSAAQKMIHTETDEVVAEDSNAARPKQADGGGRVAQDQDSDHGDEEADTVGEIPGTGKLGQSHGR